VKLSLVAALSENRVIGRDGQIPWKLRDDQQALKSLTTGHCVVMGRKTWESIGRPLPGRTSIVVTRQPAYSVPFESVQVVGDFDAALAAAKALGCEQLFVLGGAAFYELALPRADSLHLTRVHAEVEGDVLFPEFDESAWRVVSETRHEPDSRNEYPFTIQHYERI
jgi:dihydrofolate reductase